MGDLDRDALDRHITGSRYSRELLLVECSDCGDRTAVDASAEYGTTEWSPNECGGCGRPFDGDEPTEADEPEPPEPDPYGYDGYNPRVDWPERYHDGPI